MAASYTTADAVDVKQNVEEIQSNLVNNATTALGAGEGKSFPAEYFRKNEDQKRIGVLTDYISWLNSQKIPAIYTPTEKDINVLLEKDAERELYNFESFLQMTFDLDNPQHQKLVRELYPNYYERRVDVIRKTLKVQEKIAMLKLFGPQTKEDIFFIYALWSGAIEIPKNVVFDTTKADEGRGDKIKRGLLNPKTWTLTPKTAGGQLPPTYGHDAFFTPEGQARHKGQVAANNDIYGKLGWATKGRAGQQETWNDTYVERGSSVFAQLLGVQKPSALPINLAGVNQ